jgi:hypothetical protein
MTRLGRAIFALAASMGIDSALIAQKPEAAEAGAQASDTLPPDFRGRIGYRGTHEGQVSRAGPPLRSLRTRDILRSATGGQSRERAGAYNLELTFEGRAVNGRYSGSGGIGSGTVSGIRDGDRCRLFDDRHGTATEAICTRTQFSGEARLESGRDTMVMRIDAEATQFVDAVVEEREQVIAQARAADEQRLAAAAAERRAQLEAAENARTQAALRERIRSSRPATPRQIELTAQAINDDASNWNWNVLDNGSGSSPVIWEVDRGTTSIRMGYTYNGGTPGWVIARISQGQVQCLEYHDRNGSCAPPRPRRDQQGGDRVSRCYRPIIGNDPNTAPIYGSMRCD